MRILALLQRLTDQIDLEVRDQRNQATGELALDEAVNVAVQKLKDAGFSSGYLKPIVVARSAVSGSSRSRSGIAVR